MGWSSFRLNEPVKKWFNHLWDYKDSDYEVIDSALVKRMTIYGAVKQKSTGKVFCAVFLVHWERGDFNFSYKDMTEFSGPCVFECPPNIYKLLTPIGDEEDPNGWARNWRRKVEVLHKTRKHLSKGGVIKTEKPVSFTNGDEYQYFMRRNKRYYAAKLVDGKYIEGMRLNFNPLEGECEIVE